MDIVSTQYGFCPGDFGDSEAQGDFLKAEELALFGFLRS